MAKRLKSKNPMRPVRRTRHYARAAARKDRHVAKSSHGRFLTREDLLKGKATRPATVKVYNGPRPVRAPRITWEGRSPRMLKPLRPEDRPTRSERVTNKDVSFDPSNE